MAVVGKPMSFSVDVLSETRTFTLGGSWPGFGSAVVTHDVTADGCLDLLVGAPASNQVHLITGSPTGPGTGPSAIIQFAGKAGDAFGTSIAAERVPATGMTPERLRVWVGAPGADVGGVVDAGAVVYYTVSSDLRVSAPRVFTQNSPGVPGDAERGDRFGQVLAPLRSGVAVGVPGEDVGTKVDAGALWVLPAPAASPVGPGPYAVSQDSPGIPGGAEPGDAFAAALDMNRWFEGLDPVPGGESGLWVGVPGEDVGSLRDAGLVHQLKVGKTAATSLLVRTQDSPGVAGAAERGDRFGSSLLGGPGDFDDDEQCHGTAVMIGVPGEDLGSVVDAGAVNVGDGVGTTGCPVKSREWIMHLGTLARAGDRLGASLGFGGVGAPGGDVGSAIDAGFVVSSVYSPYKVWTEHPAFAGNRFGSVLAKEAYDPGPPLIQN
ncbi:hypothetical protein [Terrabacter sp. GCM10028922]|uniref:hypothetical protein n=1 Tax=Terrabacter sp. GCM10028922 TaxID=3273428 RepID=UPI0036D8CBD0